MIFLLVFALDERRVKQSYLNTTGGCKNHNRFAQSRTDVIICKHTHAQSHKYTTLVI